MYISSTTPIANGGNFTSNTINGDRIDAIAGYIKTDQAATLFVEQSGDGTNWDVSDSNAVVANTTKTFSVNLIAPFVRIRVTNASGSNQTFIRMYARGTSAGDS